MAILEAHAIKPGAVSSCHAETDRKKKFKAAMRALRKDGDRSLGG